MGVGGHRSISTPGGIHHVRSPWRNEPGYQYPHARRDARIMAMYREDWTTYQIAAELDLSRPRICQILHENGVVARKWCNRDVTPKPWTTDRALQQQPENIGDLNCVIHYGDGQ